MAAELPLDFNHPAVQEYVKLIRLQVLTPLSTLVSVATVLAAETIIRPSLGEIVGLWPTSISPKVSLVAFYYLALFGGQIGYCLLLVMAWKEHTKKAMVHGVGFPIVLANWLMAGWAVAFSFQAFTACSVLIGIIVILLVFVNLRVMLYHPAAWTSPIDCLLLHAPIRLFLLVSMTLILPLSIFLAIGHRWSKGHEEAYDHYQWEGFGVVFSTGLLGTIVAAWRSDLVWSLGTVWILWCIGAARPKPAPVSGTIIAFTVIIPVTFVAFLVWRAIRKKDSRHEGETEGRVRLEGEDEALRQQQLQSGGAENLANTVPGNHEVRSDEIWA